MLDSCCRPVLKVSGVLPTALVLWLVTQTVSHWRLKFMQVLPLTIPPSGYFTGALQTLRWPQTLGNVLPYTLRVTFFFKLIYII